MESSKDDRQNNFDLIRLAAALQVVILHSLGHLDIELSSRYALLLVEMLRPFPGVPVFFVISGYLIYMALSRSKNIVHYFKNRSLRIFPLLWASTLILSLILIVELPLINIKEFLVWVVGQLTIFQFYTPDSLRPFGVGTPNGALWTIPVELQFYILLPLLFYIAKKIGKLIYFFAGVSSFLLYYLVDNFIESEVIVKLFEVSVLFYLPHFMLGVFFAIYKDKLLPLVENRSILFLSLYIIYYLLFNKKLEVYNDLYNPNLFGVGALILLAFSIISSAYSYRNLSSNILRGWDLSYGIYVFHMIIVNWLVQHNYTREIKFLFMTLILTVVLSILSWKFIEHPALRLKNRI